MTTASVHNSKLAITPGDPAGIGPDICLQLHHHPQRDRFVIIADPDLMQQRAKQLNIPVTFALWPSTTRLAANQLWLKPITTATPAQAGVANPNNAAYVIACLTDAVQGCLKHHYSAMVTGPVDKGIINQGGIPFTGHTEFLAQQTATADVVMMLAVADKLRVALATTHIPLAKVPASITQAHLTKVLTILHQDLQQKFHIPHPRIHVCGLNPHAGDHGYLGREEIDIIEPVLNHCRTQGMAVHGPLSADTIFLAEYHGHADAILAMYHDQGLPVLKQAGFGQAVNITLGLPIIRTSVDHGTAFSLAGTGKAKADSLFTAINMALQLADKSS